MLAEGCELQPSWLRTSGPDCRCSGPAHVLHSNTTANIRNPITDLSLQGCGRSQSACLACQNSGSLRAVHGGMSSRLTRQRCSAFTRSVHETSPLLVWTVTDKSAEHRGWEGGGRTGARSRWPSCLVLFRHFNIVATRHQLHLHSSFCRCGGGGEHGGTLRIYRHAGIADESGVR